MKRLLLPLLAALALPTSVSAGDLGVADFDPQGMKPRLRTEKYKAMAKQNSFDWACGLDQKANLAFIRKPCKIEFKEGKLIVNGSKGITPKQVNHWDIGFFSHQQAFNAVRRHTDLLIYYWDSNGEITPALFAASGERECMAFYLRFSKWMSRGK